MSVPRISFDDMSKLEEKTKWFTGETYYVYKGQEYMILESLVMKDGKLIKVDQTGKPLAKGQVVVVPIGKEGFFYELKSNIAGALAGTAVWQGGKALFKNGGKLYSFIVGKNGKVVIIPNYTHFSIRSCYLCIIVTY